MAADVSGVWGDPSVTCCEPSEDRDAPKTPTNALLGCAYRGSGAGALAGPWSGLSEGRWAGSPLSSRLKHVGKLEGELRLEEGPGCLQASGLAKWKSQIIRQSQRALCRARRKQAASD